MPKLIPGENDFATIYSELAKDWDVELNGDHSPSDYLPMSRYVAHWKCSKCGHRWSSSIAHRTQGTGCPKCRQKEAWKKRRDEAIKSRGSLLDLFPQLCLEWHPTKNGTKKPSDYLPGSEERIVWICTECGYEWTAPISRRAKRHSGCPRCASERRTSFPEQAFCYYLSQVTETVSRFVEEKKEIDVYLPILKVGIEYDGIAFHEDCDGFEKDRFFANRGVKIIHVKEISPRQQTRIENGVVLYSYKGSDYSNICEAIRLVFELLGIPPVEMDIEKDRYKIREKYLSLKKKNSIIAKRPELAGEWDYEGNGKTKPEYLSYSSAKIVKWICPKGHHYTARVYNRYKGVGCPVCAGKALVKGINDLATLYPDLAEEWDYARNSPLKPDEVLGGGHKSFFWKCRVCGNSWKAIVLNRIKGTGCPYCSNHTLLSGVNDLETMHPELAKEWHPMKNGSLTPSQVLDGSERKYWWQCPICGFAYSTAVSNRIKGTGCPKCAGGSIAKKAVARAVAKSGSLAEKRPDLLAEWDYEKNDGLDPALLSPGSAKKVFWVCKECGNKWKAAISHRVDGSKCPKCAIKGMAAKKKRKVLLVETGQVFDGAVDAARWLGIKSAKEIGQCCNGKKETYRGYHWKFCD